MFRFHDRWGSPDPTPVTVLAASRDENLDGTDTLDLVTDRELAKGSRVLWRDSMGLWHEWVAVSSRLERSTGLPLYTTHYADAVSELSGFYIEDKRNRTASAAQCVAKALEGTRWSTGRIEAGTLVSTADLSFYHTNALQALQDVCDTFGLELFTTYEVEGSDFRVTRRLVNVVGRRGGTTVTRRFTYGRDLEGIQRTIDSSDVITRLYGWGKGLAITDEDGDATGGYTRKISFRDINGGKPYVEDEDALSRWGLPGADGRPVHVSGDVDFPDCEDPAQLLDLTRRELERRTTPKVSYECDVAALTQAGMGADGVAVGDQVHVVDTSFTPALRLEGRVTRIESDLLDPAQATITLGNVVRGITGADDAWRQQLDGLLSHAGAWDSAASGSGPYINDLINRVNEIMNATGGYTYLKPGVGILVYDKPEDQNPTKCIQIGGGYWRIANSKKSNGDWDFRTLADARGLYADTIFTGMLHDAASRNWWNLDSGEMHIGNGSITINGPDSTQITISPQDGFRIYQNGSYVGGLDIDSKGEAYVRSSRTGISSSLYVTTGTTTGGNPGTSFVNGTVNYMDIEALTAIDGPKGQTNGAGLAVLNKPFLAASDYYHHVWLFPPTYKDTYLKEPPEQLYLARDETVYLQRSDKRGLFIGANQAILQFDDKHWVKVDSSGVQCRCGSHGFGWLDGKFVDDLTWS